MEQFTYNSKMKKGLLLILLLGLSICCKHQCAAQPQYTLSLQYACRERISKCSCEGEVWWNGKRVFELEPRDYQIKTASVKVSSRDGQNVLEIKGKGKADSFGLTIDNVKLVKDGTNKNLVVNGGFQHPDQNGKWKIYDRVEGWTGKQFEIGEGKIYNCRWNSQVCQLDANFKNSVLRQSFDLDDRATFRPIVSQPGPVLSPLPHVLLPNPGVRPVLPVLPVNPMIRPPISLKAEYILSFDWAPRTNGNNNLASSKGAVFIGNQKIADLQADCYNSGVRHTDFTLSLEEGPSTLSFRGLGQSDSYGVSISNVILRRKNVKENILVNGDFSSPCVGLGQWQYIRGGIKGWKVDVAEVGDCRVYNNAWQAGQCIELDSTANQIYTQQFRVKGC